MARQSGRAASAGGHHGGPRRATRRSHADSPAEAKQQQTAADSRSGTTADGSSHSEAGGGAVEAQGSSSTARPMAARFLTHFPHEVLRLRPRAGVFSRHGSLPRAYADQCIHVGRIFFPPSKGFFFSRSGTTAAEQQQTAAATARPVAARWKADELEANARKNKRNQAILGLIAMDSVPARQGNEINTARRSNALLTCRLAVF